MVFDQVKLVLYALTNNLNRVCGVKLCLWGLASRFGQAAPNL